MAGAGKDRMNWKSLDKKTRLKLIGTIILVVGLLSAALIYQRAANDLAGTADYEVMGGTNFENSKLYRHNLEVYGGKFNVIMDDFRRWFLGLWQGKSLAFIIAFTAIITAFAFFYTANYLIQPLEARGRNEDNSEESG
jgi:ABC-type phosphate/phosphonate transport system permease subunit